MKTPVIADTRGRPYHTVPNLQLLLGSKPITLEPVSEVSASVSSPSAADRTDRELYVAIVFHVTENPSSREMAELTAAMNSFSVRLEFTVKVLYPLKSSSILLLIALSSSIYALVW